MSEHHVSDQLFAEAKKFIPGGVNSPVRAYGSVGGTPRFIKRGKGAHIFDEDDNQFIDYVLSWGPLILGHSHPKVVEALKMALENGTSFGAPTRAETELAELVVRTVPSVEQIRFVNSGTEACMSALRLARAYTRRQKIIKFAGNYHGHADLLLVQAGSGVTTLGLPDSPGVTPGTTQDTLIANYNDIEGIRALFEQYPSDIAAVIVEPVAGNMGFIQPKPGFLGGILRLCKEYGAVSIFDEVMTGFRVSPGGAQERYGLDPDLTTLGKVIGGGLPVGAYAGKEEIMQLVAPAGQMYQAGTLSGNPLAMTAGLATLSTMLEAGVFDRIEQHTTQLRRGIEELGHTHGIQLQADNLGSMFGFYFLTEEEQIYDYTTAKQYADVKRYATYFHNMLDHGIYMAPSQFEVGFVSSQHTKEVIDTTLQQLDQVFSTL